MSLVARKAPATNPSFILILLATTAAAALLGGCNQTGPLAGNGFASSGTKLAAVSESEASSAAAQWAAAYAKKPRDPKIALGYAMTLKAIGNKDQAMNVLQGAYQANPSNGELAAELGRLALDVGRLDIAKYTLHVAESQGIRDWKTLSAQGTLHAKQGEHAQAQQYYLASLEAQPDSISVINNLALSYALDGKADRGEALLRKAVKDGHDDKRVRQNLALVLGVQGKFTEAKKMAALDMPEGDAKASMAYLRNMLSAPTKVAALGAGRDEEDAVPNNWDPYAETGKSEQPTKTASIEASAIQARTVETPLPMNTPAPEPRHDTVAALAPAAAAMQQATEQKSSAAMTTIAKRADAGTETVAAPVEGTAAKGDKLGNTTVVARR